MWLLLGCVRLPGSVYAAAILSCGFLPGSVYVVAVGFLVVYRMFISDCSESVGGCQRVAMGL